MRAIFILAVALGLAAAGDLPSYDPAEVLRRVIQRMEAHDQAMLNYTCVETISRDFFSAVGSAPASCAARLEDPAEISQLIYTDRMRLEVTLAPRGEIYSWLGARQLGEIGIDQLVHRGPIATGGFGALLSMVFRQASASFVSLGEATLDGSAVFAYSYHVDAGHSSYKVKTIRNQWVRSAYGGTLLVDPWSAEVVRIVLQTSELPASTGECQTTLTLDFENQQIGHSQARLPRRVGQLFITPAGGKTENTITFSGCREYHADSTVTFQEESEPPVSAGSNHSPTVQPSIPANLPFILELESPIESDTAAAGDPFRARLLEPLRDSRGRTIAPGGALVEGRLLRVQVFLWPVEEVVMVFKPKTVEILGAQVPLTAVPDWQEPKTRKPVPIYLREPWEMNSAVFHFPGQRIVLGHSFRSNWRTAP